MSEKMILFTKENREKVIAGTKTMTRRLIKIPDGYKWFCEDCDDDGNVESIVISPRIGGITKEIKPRYQVGDTLLLQEPYQITLDCPNADFERVNVLGHWTDDGRVFSRTLNIEESKKFWGRKKPKMITSGRYMYKSLARHRLKCTEVIAERLQEISIKDVMAEGVPIPPAKCGCFYEQKTERILKCRAWVKLWDSINKPRGHGWKKNDWVFGYRFERELT